MRQSSPFSLSGKVAVVTGSTRGIGRACVEALARAGAQVVVSARRQAACDAAADELRAAGHDAVGVACHVGREDEQAALVERAVETYGGIDLLVCNAATNPVYGPLSEVPDEAYDKVMHTNVRSNFTLAKRVCPLIAARGGGAVVLMSSIAALRGDAGLGAYAISKAAQAALARNLAVEWGPRGVRVNALAPGLIKTDFARALWDDPTRAKAFADATPLRRLGEPDDIGDVVVFLCSAASRFVTGQLLVADGGRTVG